MKFGKLLKTWAAEEEPENSELVLRFKDLKKQLKLVKPAEQDATDLAILSDLREPSGNTPLDSTRQIKAASAMATPPVSNEERLFFQTLKEDLDKFNEFFIDKEEDFIIRIQALDDSLERDKTQDVKKLGKLRKAYADLHGSMILLLHWSLLNFIAVIKILKKHDKHSGIMMRQPLLASVLKQPFNSTERITGLIKQAEEKSLLLLEREGATSDGAGVDAFEENREKQEELSRRTKAALSVWQDMRDNASTPSTIIPLPEKRKLDEPSEDGRPASAAEKKEKKPKAGSDDA